ncbi:hypothetical protein STEG23_003436 [Scotinomys teguina]
MAHRKQDVGHRMFHGNHTTDNDPAKYHSGNGSQLEIVHSTLDCAPKRHNVIEPKSVGQCQAFRKTDFFNFHKQVLSFHKQAEMLRG